MEPARAILSGRRRAARAVLPTWLAAACASAAAHAQGIDGRGGEDSDEYLSAHPFSIPDKQGARALYDVARAHAFAGRWTEAVTAIQQLIDEHSGSVIELPLHDEAPPRSQQPLYLGAAQAARELFARMPKEARAAYVDRFQAKLHALRARASLAFDTTALADLARRHPLTPDARAAWCILGDLEAESGNLDAARAAWARALETLPGEPHAAGLAARARWNPGEAALRASRSSSLSLAREAVEGLEVPASDAHQWDSPLAMSEGWAGPFGGPRQVDLFNSFPILAEDCVLASDSLRLTAADALTGRLRWRSAEHPGWATVRSGSYVARDGSRVEFKEFFDGIDPASLMIAPAAGSGIAVAALQVPITANGNATFQQLHITMVIPDRRLYAFDLETGAPLWDHAPPPLWDGDSGDFTQRMRVAGPPVIAGARVLVPMWRPQGRIAYHVACYDLHTGAYLWSTQVASGQRPLNMFGRLEREFCAPPLVVQGEQVLAQSELGTIAALDLFCGEILWQTVYPQVPLPPANGMEAAQRSMYWRTAPPAVEGGVIVSTPTDSTHMLGIDLHTGAVLWTVPHTQISRSRRGYGGPWTLLGVRDDKVYLAARSVVVRWAPHHLTHASGPTEELSSGPLFGDGNGNPAQLPRAVLTARHVIVPTPERRIALDRDSLDVEDLRASGSWGRPRAGFGNLALGDGAMFSLSAQELCGVLDWSSIELRLEAEFAQHPGDSAIATRLGDFLRERAASELGDSRHTAALDHLRRAQTILGPPAATGLAEAKLALFESLRLEAKVLTFDANSRLSLERLERALPLAPDPARAALVLSEIARAARLSASTQRFDSALALLDERYGGLEFPVVPEGWKGQSRSVRRWVIEQRIECAHEHDDLALEFAALLDLLDRCGPDPFSSAIAEVDEETPELRIERLLSRGPRARKAWQPFEDKARAALEVARQARDGRALERVIARFPHTVAARDARDARLRLALDAGDVQTAVGTAFGELPDDWSAEKSTPREAQLAWLAARALKQGGNGPYARSLLERLGRFQPEVAADEREPTVTFAALAAAQDELDSSVEAHGAEPSYAVPSREVLELKGNRALLGPLASGARSLLVLAAEDRLEALAEDGTLAWTAPVEGQIASRTWVSHSVLVQGSPERAGEAAFAGRVVALGRRGLSAFDGATGQEAWTWSPPGLDCEPPLFAADGVVTLRARTEDGPSVLVGLDSARGTELWRREFDPELWPQPIQGSGLAVLLPRDSQVRKSDGGAAGPSAQVLELATGTLVRELDIGAAATAEDRLAAWIEHGRLILPRFGRARGTQDAVSAFDLDTATLAWRVPGDPGREFDSVVRCAGGTYLIYVVSSGSESGGIVELDTRFGTTRKVPGVTLGSDDAPVGLRAHAVTELAAPYLFIGSSVNDEKELLIRAVHLPYGQRWAWRPPIAQADLESKLFPLPAVSSRTVVFAYTEALRSSTGRARTLTHFASLERESGELKVERDRLSDPDLGKAEDMELATLGNLLVVCGKRKAVVLAGQEEER